MGGSQQNGKTGKFSKTGKLEIQQTGKLEIQQKWKFNKTGKLEIQEISKFITRATKWESYVATLSIPGAQESGKQWCGTLPQTFHKSGMAVSVHSLFRFKGFVCWLKACV